MGHERSPVPDYRMERLGTVIGMAFGVPAGVPAGTAETNPYRRGPFRKIKPEGKTRRAPRADIGLIEGKDLGPLQGEGESRYERLLVEAPAYNAAPLGPKGSRCRAGARGELSPCGFLESSYD